VFSFVLLLSEFRGVGISLLVIVSDSACHDESVVDVETVDVPVNPSERFVLTLDDSTGTPVAEYHFSSFS
jgi:hypothetical protein